LEDSMTAKNIFLALSLALLLAVQLACSLVSGVETPDAFATLNALYTAAARTLEAVSTQPALTTTPGLPLPTGTSISSSTASPQNTPITPSPVPTSRCDAADFVADVNYPDGSIVAQNAVFIKTWRVKNVGDCMWTPSYALVFIDGDPMNGSVVYMPSNVNPGQTVDISVTLTAPNKDGKYRGYWKLRNASKVLFGVGPQTNIPLWVDIRVRENTYVAYEFVANYCKADWENNNAALPCPGKEGDNKGFVLKVNAPKLENGAAEDEPGLLTSPNNRSNGLISGQYSAFKVRKGDRFLTLLSCQYKAKKCDVTFRLDYKTGGKIKTLASWHEMYEGQFTPVDLDLSSLAGDTVKFILVVTANGSATDDDEAIWLNPYILRYGTPTPTPTPTSTPTRTPTP
jgi:hypothetical protein